MTKVLKCGDLMLGCDFGATGATEQEVLQKAAEHAKSAHGISATPELAEKLKGAIKNE